MRSTLRSPRLRRIVGAYAINRLGTWFGFVALSVLVFDRTGSAIAVAATLVSAQVVPAFLSPALIARVEASPRRGVLSGLYLFEALATAGLAVLAVHFVYPAMLVLVALDGTVALATGSLLRAETARAAREEAAAAGRQDEQEAEREANAAMNVAFSLTFTLGPALGGLVVAGAGAPAALWIDAATFAICAAMVVDLRPYVAAGGDRSVKARLEAAWLHITAQPALSRLLIVESLALVFFSFSGPIEVVFAKQTLAAGDSGYGALLAAWGIGVVAGSLVFARASGAALGAMVSTGTLAIGAAYLGFAAAPSIFLACAAALVGGLGNGVQWASVVSLVQRLTPQELHGRLMGALESLGAICPAIGIAAGGTLVALTSPRGAFLVAGIGACAAAAGFLWLALRMLRLPATGIHAPGEG